MRELRLRDLVYSMDDVDFDSGSAATIKARLSYSVPNVPGSFTQARRLRAGRDETGHWAIRTDRPDGREHLPWEVAPIAVRRGVHFVIAHPSDVDLGALPEQLERGYDAMAATLPVKLARRYLVVIGANPGETEKLTSGILGLDTLAAVADSDVREEGSAKTVESVVSQRLVLIWSNFAGLEPAAQERLVTHELTHLALAEETSGRTPAWLVEGAALLVSEDRRIFEPAAPSLSDLSRPRAMARLAGALQADAYARSSAVAFHIAQRYGREAFFRLYEAFNDSDLTAASAAELADAATRRVLGISLAGLEADAAAQQSGSSSRCCGPSNSGRRCSDAPAAAHSWSCWTPAASASWPMPPTTAMSGPTRSSMWRRPPAA